MAVVLIVLLIVAIPFIVALFVRKNYSVHREIKINKPNQVVFDYIRYLKNHDNFNKWGKMDSHMIRQYYGTDGTVGFISSWESKNRNVGKGEQRIIKVSVPKRIDFELRFLKPYSSVAHVYMTTDPTSRQETIVVWGLKSKMNYPMNFMLLFNVQEAIGKDIEKGLSHIKEQLEKQKTKD